jgi:PmbA protein
VPEDPFCGLADPDQIARSCPTIELCDHVEPTPDQLRERARAAEEAARAVPGVTNSEGAEAGWGHSRMALRRQRTASRRATSSAHRRQRLGHRRQRHRHGARLRFQLAWSAPPTSTIPPRSAAAPASGRSRRLGPRKAATARVPIVYDPRVSRRPARPSRRRDQRRRDRRGTSFLKDKLGQPRLAGGVTVIDDPHRRAACAPSRSTAKASPTRGAPSSTDGVLTTWLLDLRSARQLGLASTGHAARGTSSPPSPRPDQSLSRARPADAGEP